jgi:hypothetical protein
MAKQSEEMMPSKPAAERGRGDDAETGSSFEDPHAIAGDEDDEFDDDDDDLEDPEDDDSEDL